MGLSQKANYGTIIKIFLIIVFLPFVTVWYVWQKTNWSERNKWIVTAVVAVFCLIAFASDEDAVQPLQQKVEVGTNSNNQVPVGTQENNSTDSASAPQLEDVNLQQEGEIFKVVHVVDGDTIKLDNGQVVRYIGIDTPETVDPRKPVQCFGKEASAKNRELVEGKEVRLVKDISETDKYGRLLRYVYVGDEFINDYLVRQGYAHSSSYPPDVKYQDQFRSAEQEAREGKRGLWSDGACEAELKTVPAPIVTPKSVVTSDTVGGYVCNCSKTCAQMGCSEAQYQLNTCGCSRRDADHDGIACDSDCQ